MESKDARNPLPCVISWGKKKLQMNQNGMLKKIHINTEENLRHFLC